MRENEAQKPPDAAIAGGRNDTPSAIPIRLAGRLPSPRETAAADVLVFVRSVGPIPHAGIVTYLVQKGCTKKEAVESIALLQRERWIMHDLLKGYVLSPEGEVDD